MIRIAACGRWAGERGAALDGLRGAGYSVQVQEDGAGPLECVVGPAPDLLIYSAAHGVPWQGEALRVVRRVHPEMPLVIVTSDGSVEERLRYAAVRPAYVAVDPIDSTELIEAIEALVGRPARGSTRAS